MSLPQHSQSVQLNLFSEVENYHNPSRFGFFTLLTRNKTSDRLVQSCHKLTLMRETLMCLDRNLDTYISQAEFKRPSRLIMNLTCMSVAFADLDLWHEAKKVKVDGKWVYDKRDKELAERWEGMTEAQAVATLLQHCADEGIPLPNVIMSTGRGLYVKWFMSKPAPAQALMRYNKLQETIVNLFEPWRADINAKDASRVLRLENTVNSKSGTTCKVVWCNENLYDFEFLCSEFLPMCREDYNAQQKLKAESYQRYKNYQLQLIKTGGQNKKGLKLFNQMELNWARCCDIRKLAELRGGVPVGERDKFLWVAASFASWVMTLEAKEIDALGKEFAPGLSNSEIHNYTSSVVNRLKLSRKGEKVTYRWTDENGVEHQKLVDPRYKYRNSTLIKLFNITPAEQQKMQTIIGLEEKRERARLREEERRRAEGAIPRAEYLNIADQKRQEARLRCEQGESQVAIAKAMGISRTAVQYYLLNNK